MADPKRKTAKKGVKRTPYEQAMDAAIPQWLNYPGNKRQLIPIMMNMLPSPANRFVDLFGGTGITGVEAYKYDKCQEVIYNDLEYDMVLLLEWLYVTPISEIIDTYVAVKERWFGDIDRIELFEEDTKEYKKRTGDKSGGAHIQMWRALVNHYNANRIILWDRPEDAELMRIINAVEDKDIRRQLTEFVNGIDRQAPPSSSDKPLSRPAQEMMEHSKKVRAQHREDKARAHELTDGTDIFAARGDFFLPGELLFIMLNTFMGIQDWANLGRGRDDKTPQIGLIRTPNKFVPFVEALKQTPMTFYSHSFTEGWIERDHERPRTRIAEERWRDMLASLTSEDIVFVDPPYHGSAAPYNNVYNQKLEIYLFAFCQLLDERDIPWMFTDNLIYENDIFKGWIENYYAYKLKPGALNLYQGKKNESDGEVIVTNFKPAITRGIPKQMLVEVKGKQKRGALKWSSNGERTR